VSSVRLLTNNPLKVQALLASDIDVSAVESIAIPPVATNVDYLRTKRDRMGHTLLTTPAVEQRAGSRERLPPHRGDLS
jgi:3,4-dihydroxy 2-butanone 4-phosphate synthase / GTP cyclohydrolase II